MRRGNASAAVPYRSRRGKQEEATMIRNCLLLGRLLAVLALAAVTLDAAQAQAPYPNPPMRLEVGFAAGGPTDIIARVLAAKLSDSLGQQVYVENRGGAGGNIAVEAVARAEPDGYTLKMSLLSSAVNET